MEDPDEIHPCAICLDGMVAGGRQAIFTAECCHAFHFDCISASVAYGHLVCPLCKAQWRDLPIVRPPSPAPPPPPPPPPPRSMRVVQPPLVRPTSSWPRIPTQQRRPPPPPVHFVRGRPLPPPPPPVRPSRPPMPTPRPPPPLPVNFVNGQPPPSPPQPARNGQGQSPPPPPPPVHFVHGRPLPPPPPPVRPSRPPMPTPRPPPPLPANFVNGQPRPPTPQPVRDEQVQSPPPPIFDDDEQPGPAYGSAGAAPNGAVVVKTHSEYPAIARDSSNDSFAVLVHVKAPRITETIVAGGEAPRAPLDLVMVLDVSGSMSGHKLALLKQAMRFVIDNLGPDDRLCVVSFSSEARRVTRLTRMTNAGKALSVSAVESLAARGGTNIAEGLRMAAMVLDERRHRNAVSSVVLLSDGQDTYTSMRRWGPSSGQVNDYDALVPPSFVRTGADGDWSAPIHTFGFGNDHDAAAMHVIAEATGGTFSFIENEAVIQDAFAQCVGGLLSVVVQEARIAVACVHPGVRVILVKSGRYESRIDEDGRAATVRIGELYADEERHFLLFLAVPRAEATDGDTAALVKLVISYRDAATGVGVSVTAEDTVVARPEHAPGASERSVEVERERVRVEAAEDIAAAREAAERGEYQEAAEILENRQRVLAQSEAARYGDPVIMALEAELQEMRVRVSNRQSYLRSGRAYMLAGMSAHQQQRATSRQMMPEVEQTSSRRPGLMRMIRRSNAARYMAVAPVVDVSMSYATPAMRAMLLRSREAGAEAHG